MHAKYIAVGPGVWGSGATRDEAIATYLRMPGAKPRAKLGIWEYLSPLPFAPAGRIARGDEADAYVDAGGSICRLRCSERQIEPDAESEANAWPWPLALPAGTLSAFDSTGKLPGRITLEPADVPKTLLEIAVTTGKGLDEVVDELVTTGQLDVYFLRYEFKPD